MENNRLFICGQECIPCEIPDTIDFVYDESKPSELYDPTQVKCTWGCTEVYDFSEADNFVGFGNCLNNVTLSIKGVDICLKIDNDNLKKLEQLINKQEDKC